MCSSDLLLLMGEPRFRGTQLFKWLSQGIRSFEQMTNLPKRLIQQLSEKFFIDSLTLDKKQVSKTDGTIKYLWKLKDGNAVETVLMRYKYGNTVCISSQVGCRQGCVFCASTIGGLIRNLSPAEMLNEVLYTELDSGYKISNIVLMGIGEPLDNFDNVIKFLSLVNDSDGMNIGMRHISLSTCGLAENVDKLAESNLQLTLSVSLHAPDNETRTKLMPVNRVCDIDSLLCSCEDYYKKTGRRISFEYAMIDKINDSDEQAKLLAKHASKIGAHINLIPLNYVKERDLKPSSSARIKRFYSILEENKANVTIRRRLGSDIDASCGQLRKKAAEGREL